MHDQFWINQNNWKAQCVTVLFCFAEFPYHQTFVLLQIPALHVCWLAGWWWMVKEAWFPHVRQLAALTWGMVWGQRGGIVCVDLLWYTMILWGPILYSHNVNFSHFVKMLVRLYESLPYLIVTPVDVVFKWWPVFRLWWKSGKIT